MASSPARLVALQTLLLLAALLPALQGLAQARLPPAPAPAAKKYERAAEATARWISWKVSGNAAGRWPMNTTERCCGHNYTLYYGPPGVALFYTQLAQATGLAEHRSMAVATGVAIQATLPAALSLFGNNTALYYGSAGMGFALRQLAASQVDAGGTHGFLGSARAVDDSILAAATPVPAAGGLTWNNNTDVAHGAAGTALYLLWAAAGEADADRAQRYRAAAGKAAAWLLTTAVHTTAGWKWPRGHDSDGNHDGTFFPNFCCGTAGVAYFMATLFQQTGAAAYKDAALRGAEYLLSVARLDDDGLLIYHDEPLHENLYYLGWCHGPAGTARLWAKLYEVTGDAKWWSLVLRGVRTIAGDALPDFAWLLNMPAQPRQPAWQSVSQCCGGAAALNFLAQVDAYAVRHGLPTGGADPMGVARRVADVIVETKGRPCGPAHLNATCFPSPEEHDAPTALTEQVGWMQGAAGVAASLLHFGAHVSNTSRGSRLAWPDEPW